MHIYTGNDNRANQGAYYCAKSKINRSSIYRDGSVAVERSWRTDELPMYRRPISLATGNFSIGLLYVQAAACPLYLSTVVDGLCRIHLSISMTVTSRSMSSTEIRLYCGSFSEVQHEKSLKDAIHK